MSCMSCMGYSAPLTPALSLGLAITHISRWQEVNPKGIPSLSPGLRGTSYPGLLSRTVFNPERVAARRRFVASRGRSGQMLQPLQGWRILASITPRVARASQPWAGGYNPFGIEKRQVDLWVMASPTRCDGTAARGEGWGEGHKRGSRQKSARLPGVAASSPQPSPPKEERETETSAGGSVIKMRPPREGTRPTTPRVPSRGANISCLRGRSAGFPNRLKPNERIRRCEMNLIDAVGKVDAPCDSRSRKPVWETGAPACRRSMRAANYPD
jgi:hypothetical protein